MKQIWVTFQKVGYHHFPKAKTEDRLKDVSYLGFTHRHLFKFKVSIQVFHDDREIEFHQFLNWLTSEVVPDGSLNHKSCEMIADDMAELITKKYPGRLLDIEVSEDGECGVVCKY